MPAIGSSLLFAGQVAEDAVLWPDKKLTSTSHPPLAARGQLCPVR